MSFKNVIAFNLDEYYGIKKDDINSYHHFMNENLFDHIDIPKENINIPSGEIGEKEIKKFCSSYEKEIEKFGGIDIQLLGIGRTGHIGFNEPGSHFNSKTRLITLDHTTRFDASKSFNGIENVPTKAITMGVRTIFNAKRIIVMAWGLHKSLIVSGLIIIPIVFSMGYAGLISKSLNTDVSPDLSFFSLLLFNQNEFLAFLVIVLGLSLTISTVDTLINAISSSIIVDGKFFHKLTASKSLNYSKYLHLKY